MLIDPEHCYNFTSVYHFKTPYIIDTRFVVTLFCDFETGEVDMRSRYTHDKFTMITPEYIKKAILQFLEDPLVEIEMLRKIHKYMESYE